jgi:hypothetical protein
MGCRRALIPPFAIKNNKLRLNYDVAYELSHYPTLEIYIQLPNVCALVNERRQERQARAVNRRPILWISGDVASDRFKGAADRLSARGSRALSRQLQRQRSDLHGALTSIRDVAATSQTRQIAAIARTGRTDPRRPSSGLGGLSSAPLRPTNNHAGSGRFLCYAA